MKHLLGGIFLALLIASAFSKTMGFPQEDIAVVIEKARTHVQKEKLEVGDSFIQKVEFKNRYDEYHPQFWEVTFRRIPEVKGGYLIVRVFNDGRIDHGFGE